MLRLLSREDGVEGNWISPCEAVIAASTMNVKPVCFGPSASGAAPNCRALCDASCFSYGLCESWECGRSSDSTGVVGKRRRSQNIPRTLRLAHGRIARPSIANQGVGSGETSPMMRLQGEKARHQHTSVHSVCEPGVCAKQIVRTKCHVCCSCLNAVPRQNTGRVWRETGGACPEQHIRPRLSHSLCSLP